MNLLMQAIQRQVQAVKRNLQVSALLLFTTACTLYLAYTHGKVPKALAYFAALWVCTLVTDMFTINKAIKEFPVRKPLRETVVIVSLMLVGATGMMLRFAWLDWEHTAGMMKLTVAGMMFLCMFPVITGIVLLASKYRLPDIGFRFSPLILTGVAVLLITAGTGLAVAPEGLTYGLLMKEIGGVGNLLFLGFITAALPEEFLRLVCQTRFGTLLNNKALGWYLACFIWAFLHFPKWYGEGGDVAEGILSSIRIIPLGLMWSYMIHRTKNIFPSIIAHGLNIWGLQNF
jgi:membrane protease YdiL (CAAX protease family)